ncbi:MAG: hypothetical protein ACYSTY_14280, partial [Planctomycetota bacterium]
GSPAPAPLKAMTASASPTSSSRIDFIDCMFPPHRFGPARRVSYRDVSMSKSNRTDLHEARAMDGNLDAAPNANHPQGSRFDLTQTHPLAAIGS